MITHKRILELAPIEPETDFSEYGPIDITWETNVDGEVHILHIAYLDTENSLWYMTASGPEDDDELGYRIEGVAEGSVSDELTLAGLFEWLMFERVTR